MYPTRLALRFESQAALPKATVGIVCGVKWRLTNVFDELHYAVSLRKVFEKKKRMRFMLVQHKHIFLGKVEVFSSSAP